MKSIATHTKQSSIDEVIKELKMVASFHFNSSSNRKKASLNAEWLQELLSYKDETLMTEQWLYHNFLLCSNYCHFFNGDDFYLKINRTIGEICFVEVENKIDGEDYHHECVIKTVGQLRMFLTLCEVPKKFIKKLE